MRHQNKITSSKFKKKKKPPRVGQFVPLARFTNKQTFLAVSILTSKKVHKAAERRGNEGGSVTKIEPCGRLKGFRSLDLDSAPTLLNTTP